jgi:hypothetical protein
MGAGVRVPVEKGVGLYVVRMNVVMVVCGEFRRRHPAMCVIVGVSARCVGIHFVTAVRRYRVAAVRRWRDVLPVVRESHLHRPSDPRLVRVRPEFHLRPYVCEAAVAFGQARADDYRLQKVECRGIRRRAPHNLI